MGESQKPDVGKWLPRSTDGEIRQHFYLRSASNLGGLPPQLLQVRGDKYLTNGGENVPDTLKMLGNSTIMGYRSWSGRFWHA